MPSCTAPVGLPSIRLTKIIKRSPRLKLKFAWALHLMTWGAITLYRLVLIFAFVGGVVVMPAHAQRSVEMPQTPAFTEAYGTALSLAKEFPGSRVVAIASTYSMYPMLDWDSIVVIAPVAIDQIRVGDVVCFRDKTLDGLHTLLHRVERIRFKDGGLVTRGDHLDRADPHLVGADSLVGRAVYVVYFDRTGEQRTVRFPMPSPKRHERVVKLSRD